MTRESTGLFVVLMAICGFACGGADKPPQAGRGWWCGSSNDDSSMPVECFRSYEHCADNLIRAVRGLNFECESQMKVYCFQYGEIGEATRVWSCWEDASTCANAATDVESTTQVISTCISAD